MLFEIKFFLKIYYSSSYVPYSLFGLFLLFGYTSEILFLAVIQNSLKIHQQQLSHFFHENKQVIWVFLRESILLITNDAFISKLIFIVSIS